MSFRKILTFSLLSALLLVAGSSLAQTQSNQKPDTPQQLEQDYRDAWQFVADRYYDETKLGDWLQWQHKYDGKLTNREQLYQAVKEMAASINDPWTQFYTPADIKHKNNPVKGQVDAGFWILLNKNGAPYVELCEQGTVAYDSSIRAGDTIISVNGTKVLGMTDEQVRALLSGTVGQTLAIEYAYGNNHATTTVTLSPSRDIQSQARILPGGVLYAKLAAFNREDVDAFETAIDRALAQSKQQPRGLILDLRANPGGFVKAAQYVASMFIEKGALFTYQSRDGKTVTRETTLVTDAPFLSDGTPAARANLLRHLPMVVLIDNTTRSAAETVTMALKDNNRARIVGEKSYGKSIAYDNFPQDFGGALELTIANISSPSGLTWQGKGLTPDVIVSRPRISTGTDIQLDAAVAALP